MQLIASNKKALFDYQILDTFEAGLVLLGPEIKAVRAKRVTIAGSYVKPLQNSQKVTELWWIGSNFHVSDGDATRTKKVLVHRREIDRLLGKLSSGEYTIVPLELYLQRGIAKLKIALATRRKKEDKRQLLKERDIEKNLRQGSN